VAILIATKEASLPELTAAHDRDVQFWTTRWRDYLTEGSRAQQSRGDGVAYVAESDGRAVGFVAYHHTKRHGADAELESIYVLPGAQRHGIGSALLRVVARRLVKEGSRSLCVGYDARNPFKSFYAKHGATELNRQWAIWRDLGDVARGKGGPRTPTALRD